MLSSCLLGRKAPAQLLSTLTKDCFSLHPCSSLLKPLTGSSFTQVKLLPRTEQEQALPFCNKTEVNSSDKIPQDPSHELVNEKTHPSTPLFKPLTGSNFTRVKTTTTDRASTGVPVFYKTRTNPSEGRATKLLSPRSQTVLRQKKSLVPLLSPARVGKQTEKTNVGTKQKVKRRFNQKTKNRQGAFWNSTRQHYFHSVSPDQPSGAGRRPES